MTDEGEEPKEKKTGFAVASLVCSVMATLIAVGAMVLGVLGPIGGCAGGYYALMAEQEQRSGPRTTTSP